MHRSAKSRVVGVEDAGERELDAIIEIQGLVKRCGALTAVDGVSFRAREGASA